MNTHYSAFISYKHAKADTQVASEIQKRLEHFHVPAAIRKKTGIKKISQIFRDKEELPITSDLNEDISYALDHADFLIVICSSSTKESFWVPREIRYFLKNHTKRQILTVLVDGEPQDVIPEELLSDTVKVTAPDGTEYEKAIHYEPLSCDFREGIRTARKTEIPRLAAALLGCSYDELVMRERQYKRRRAAAVLAPLAVAAAAGISYLAWSRREIQKNYEQALINQSVFLSSQSRQLAEKGDRFRAVQLAMEALPKEGDDRPLTAQAQRALAEALEAYMPPGTRNNAEATRTVMEFQAQGSVQEAFSDLEGKHIYALDDNGLAYVWDAKNGTLLLMLETKIQAEEGFAHFGEALHEKFVEGGIQKIYQLGTDRILVLTDKGLQAFYIETGEEAWQFTDPGGFFSSSAAAVGTDQEKVYLALAFKDDLVFEEKKVGCCGVVLSAETGEEISRTQIPMLEDTSFYVTDICVSPGQQQYAFTIRRYSEEIAELYVCSAADGTIRKLRFDEKMPFVQDMIFADDGTFVVMWYPELTAEHEGGSYFLGMNTIQNFRIRISSMDLETEKLNWQTEFESPQINELPVGRGLGRMTGELPAEDELILGMYANKLVVLDAQSGKKMDEVENTAAIRHAYGGDGSVRMYLKNGSIGNYRLDRPGQVNEINYIEYDVKDADYYWNGEKSAFLVRTDTGRIRICDVSRDEDFVRFAAEPMPVSIGVTGHDLIGGYLMFYDNDGTIYFYDLEDKEPVRVVYMQEAAGEELKIPEYLGKEEGSVQAAESAGDTGHVYAWFYEMISETFFRVDVSDKTVTRIVPETEDVLFSIPVLVNDRIICRTYDRVIVYRIREEKLEEERSFDLEDILRDIMVSPSGNKILIIMDKLLEGPSGEVLLLDTDTGEKVTLKMPLREVTQAAVWNEKEDRCAMTDGYEAVLTDGNEVIRRISEPGRDVISFTFYRDDLLVLFSGGSLGLYAAKNGETIGRTSLQYYNQESFSKKIKWEVHEKLLSLYDDRIGDDMLHLLDADTLEEMGWARYSLGYDYEHDRVISYELDRSENLQYFGYFPRYSPEELLEKGERFLKGKYMSQEDRAFYGLPAGEEKRTPESEGET